MHSSARWLSESLAQAQRAYIGPILVDEVEARPSAGLAIDHAPAVWDVCERWPQTVLFLVVEKYEKAPILVIERIDAQGFSRLVVDHQPVIASNPPNELLIIRFRNLTSPNARCHAPGVTRMGSVMLL
jgi:hypothetical protein